MNAALLNAGVVLSPLLCHMGWRAEAAPLTFPPIHGTFRRFIALFRFLMGRVDVRSGSRWL